MESAAAIVHPHREYSSNVMNHTCSDSEVPHARLQQQLQNDQIPIIQTDHTASQPLHIRVPSGAQLEMQFPRPASRSILDEEEHSPDQNMDFSIEREIVRRAKEKKLKKSDVEPKSEFHLAPSAAANGLHRKSSSQSLLDTCEDNEDELIKALEEVDHEEKVDEEEEEEGKQQQNGNSKK